ncbi:MAG: ROK family transcriptional regulator [Bryobacterales bacterium]|nr:ROK family transcriptional regulator [Bryobacterales bacterium]
MAKVAALWLRNVLRVLYQRRNVTRAQILEATGLNPASVSLALKALLDSGVILKVGALQSNGGRRREVLNLNAEAAYFVAVDLEGTRIRFALTNLFGDIQYRSGVDLEFGQAIEISTILAGIQSVVQQLDDAQRSRVLAVGISHPGFVDRRGRITAVNLDWRDFPLLEALRESLEVPVFLESAHRTCILVERWLGAAQGSDNCMYIIVGNGIGVGVFTDGHLLKGRAGAAGELGHIMIDPAAPDICRCGKRGCIEAVASCPNIVRQYQARTGGESARVSGNRVTEVFERARQGEPAAIEVLDRVGKYLGLAFSYLANLFSPEVMVVGGDLVHGQDLMLPRIRAELEKCALTRSLAGLELKVSSLGLDIGVKGAAALAFRQSLAQPALLKKMCTPFAVAVPRAQKRPRHRKIVPGRG